MFTLAILVFVTMPLYCFYNWCYEVRQDKKHKDRHHWDY